MFKVNNKWFDYNEFRESFIPSFCVTVYKYKGADTKEDYNIYDTNRIDKNSFTQHYHEQQNLSIFILTKRIKLYL